MVATHGDLIDTERSVCSAITGYTSLVSKIFPSGVLALRLKPVSDIGFGALC